MEQIGKLARDKMREVAAGLTDDEVISGMVHHEMMRRVHLWPQGVLPVKRPQGDRLPDIATLHIEVEHGSRVYVLQVGNNLHAGPLGEVTVERYPSPEHIVARGWVVD